MEKLRIGVVGTGFIGGKHIEAISRIPEAKLVAVVDSYAPKGKETAAKYGVNYYASVEEMLAGKELDAVHNCTPTSMHFSVNEKVIKANKHLYCEKPLALDAREGAMLVQLLREHPVANGVNQCH